MDEGRQPEPAYLQYWYSLWVIAALGLLGLAVDLFVGYRAVGFLFLAALLVAGLYVRFGPLLFGALLSVLVWDYFFIPPRFTLLASASDDVLMMAAFVMAAGITGLLSSRIRTEQLALAEKERRSALLQRLVSAVAAGDPAWNLRQVAEMLDQALGRQCGVFLTGMDGALLSPGHGAQPLHLRPGDEAVAQRAIRSRRPAGWGSAELPDASCLFLPLEGMQGSLGVLACRAGEGQPLTGDERDLLSAAARQLGLSLERDRLSKEAREAERLRQSELLHQALLNSVSHELRTPLTALLTAASALAEPGAMEAPGQRQLLLGELSAAGRRLDHVIGNLLDMARLNAGALALKKEWQDPGELVRLTVQGLKGSLAGHLVELDLPTGLPLIQVDYRYLEHALSNLLLNAAAYSPPGSPIRVAATHSQDSLQISVANEGPGIPPAAQAHIFDKFYRVPGSPPGGTGLGLFITRSMLEAHGGSVSLASPAQGVEFIVRLPLQAAPPVPAEARA